MTVADSERAREPVPLRLTFFREYNSFYVKLLPNAINLKDSHERSSEFEIH